MSAERDPQLEAQLARHLDGWTIRAFQQVASTMEIAHQLAAGDAAERTLVWAARQEQGRGRLGRVWVSPEGGAYFSLIVRPARPLAEIPQLSLVAGLSVAEAIRTLTGLFPSIRWPNDLLLGEKKVAGILVEVRSGLRAQGSPARLLPEPGRASPQPPTLFAAIGIGINVTTGPGELPDTATSLLAHFPRNSSLVTRHSSLAHALTGAVCGRFTAWYDVWAAQGFGPIREALRPWIGIFGHPVQLTAGSDRFEGTASDLDESGRLLVRLDSGLMRQFDMGEVTLLR